MSISFDKALGVQEQALNLRSTRAEVLANNLANADTPGFKARDIDFRSLMQQEVAKLDAPLKTHPNHMSLSDASGTPDDPAMLYRNPVQPALDGNTVDTQIEIAEYTRNAMEFEASFHFLNSKFRGLTSAIKGE